MRWIVLTVLVVFVAAIFAAPLLAEASSVAAVPLYAAFSWVCHQRPQRTWLLGAYPLAVCVRCLGIYLGALAGAIAGLRFFRRLFFAAMALLAADWLLEAAGSFLVPSGVRFATGLLLGFFLAPALWGNHYEPPLVLNLDESR
ncbi:MAG TPA: DUF2085 domain-containing protein [Bryobacterales bacterium]|nr:DUF2085 domain-containing protein [Bryobacterales bacterium]